MRCWAFCILCDFSIELGQLRGAAAIGAVARSTKLMTSPSRSVASPIRTTPPVSSFSEAVEVVAAASAAESPLAFGAESLPSSSQQQPETLNIPAVLWDRPVGSSKRVPPPVPPRSPKRPFDYVASFAAASSAESNQVGIRGVITFLFLHALPNQPPKAIRSCLCHVQGEH